MLSISNDFPDGSTKFSIVLADPPWAYGDSPTWRADSIYPTMKTDEICALPVKDITADDALLFLWATGPNLDQAFIVGEAWGFSYRQVAWVWDKQKALPGSYTLTTCEFVLVFKKGKIPKPRGDRDILQFLSLKSGRHSGKPWIVRDYIVRMFPNPNHKKIELFARSSHKQWSSWGNHTDEYHEPPIWEN